MALGAVTKLAKYVNQLINDAGIRADLADPAQGIALAEYKNQGLAAVAVGVSRMEASRKLAETVSLYDFGAQGGAADDSVPLLNALTWLYGGSNRMLVIPPGEFRAPTKIEITVNGLVRNCHLIGTGATLLFETAGGIKISMGTTSLLSKLSIKGLRTTGGVKALELVAGNSLNFIYNAIFEGLDLNGFSETGLDLGGNVFETILIGYSCSSLSATGYGVHLHNVGTGIISSVDIVGGTTRGGKHGLFVESPVSDMRIYGGTYLFGLNEGVRIDNAIGAAVFGLHVEMNWTSAGSLAAGGAGLHMSGRGSLYDINGLNSSDTFQQYVVSVFASDINITGGSAIGTYTKYGRYQQTADGSLVLFGQTPANFNAVGEVFPTMVGSLVKTKKIAKTENFRSYGATVTIDLNRGNFVRVASLGGNVIIANPTNRADVTGEEIVVELKQDGAGGRTVTWGSDFATGMTAIDAAANKGSRWTFILSGGKWSQVSFASTF